MKLTHYQAAGFYLISDPGKAGYVDAVLLAGQHPEKGDAMCDDGSGLVTDAGADLAATFRGIAAEDLDDSASAGGKVIKIIPPLPNNRFAVPCDTTVIAVTDVGELLDLGADSAHVNPGDTLTTGWAFIVEDYDISAEALAACTQGFAIGHFEMRAAQT